MNKLNTKLHTSVLLNESLEYLNIKKDGIYIDCTLGEAGHSLEILKLLGEEGKLLSIDRDQVAIDFVSENYLKQNSYENWILERSNFSEVGKIARKHFESVDGVLLDLGLSSRQLEADLRGFSYQRENEELDMRMDDRLGVKASDLLNALNENELSKLFTVYGEEKFSWKIAKAIKNSPSPITTVGELNAVVDKAVPAGLRNSSKHPARRIYQALRIVVNDELNSLEEGLKGSYSVLNPSGRLVVISFHSLEDRIVKNFFKEMSGTGEAREITRKPILPTDDEISANSRSHSAKLRVLEKI